jgi:hypothetical protein
MIEGEEVSQSQNFVFEFHLYPSSQVQASLEISPIVLGILEHLIHLPEDPLTNPKA